MQITNAVVLIELDNSDEYRQLFILDKSKKEMLLQLIKQGFFSDDEVKISQDIIDTIKVEKAKR